MTGRSRDPMTVLGAAPRRGQVESYSVYRGAHRATGLPDYTRDNLEHSDTFHRAVVNSWHREQTWNSPAYVDNLLAATRQAEQRHRETATLRHAEATALDPTGAGQDAGPDPTANEREQLAREARYSAALADTLTEQVAARERAAQTRAEWLADTAGHRARAADSAAHLAARGAAADGGQAVSAAEWLAADRAARLEDDPHRDITDTDLDHTTDRGDDRAAAQAADYSAALDGPAPVNEIDEVQVDEDVVADTRPEADQVDDQAAEPGPVQTPNEASDPRDEPDRIDEDNVRVPEPDDVDRIRRLAASVDIELRNRRSLEAQDDQDQGDARAEQLTQWHHQDQAATTDAHQTDDDE